MDLLARLDLDLPTPLRRSNESGADVNPIGF